MFNRFLALVWRVVVLFFNLFPAMILVTTGAASIPLWRPVNSLVMRLLNRVPIDTHFCHALESLSQWWLPEGMDGLKSRLIRGERLEVARALWPQVEFPDLYQEVPDDVVRPPFDDGRLVGGLRLKWLGDRYMTDAAVRSAARLGVTSACLIFFVLTAWYLLLMVAQAGDLLTQLEGGDVVIERWPGQLPTTVPTEWVSTATASVIRVALLQGLSSIVLFLSGAALTCTGTGLLAMLVLLHSWQKEKAAPYEWQSKDADVRWAYRAETRNLVRMAYRKQVEQATQYLSGLPCFLIGRATGTLRARGDLSAPTPKQPLQLDQESLFQHLLVFGGTGEGKTTALLKPLIRQLLRRRRYGMYVCDAKGVLWNDVYALARTERPDDTPIIIGTGADQMGVDVLAGLTPTQVAGTLRSVMAQVSGGAAGDDFWPDMAANLLRNILSVARAYVLTEEGADLLRSQGMSPYSLWWAYQAVLHSEHIDAATAALRRWLDLDAMRKRAEGLQNSPSEYDELKRVYDLMATKEVYDSMVYLESTWRDMAPETKSGIIASVTRLLDGFAGAEVLRDRFACGNPDKTISIADALDGQVVLNALSSVEDGLPARIVSVLIKTNLYREARSREAAFRQGTGKVKPQDQPCIVVMDEVQEIVTADVTSGLSDATFWNVARSTGVAGIFATQTAASLHQAIGKDAANNFMQQARSKVFFRTEDHDTVEYACWCAGKYERNRVYDDGHRESLEYRGLIDGWNPLSPVDETQAVQGGPTVFFSSASALLFPDRFAIGAAQVRPAYSQDNRFIPSMSGESGIAARSQALQAAAWRAEDLERDYRKSGNELADALTLADLIHMGRWHAFAQIQRAGAVRQDIIMVEHDFT